MISNEVFLQKEHSQTKNRNIRYTDLGETNIQFNEIQGKSIQQSKFILINNRSQRLKTVLMVNLYSINKLNLLI